MMQNPFEIAYKSLSNADCPDCLRALNFNKLELQLHEAGAIRDDYHCECGATFEIGIEIQAKQVHVTFREDGQRVNDLVVPRATIRQRSHPADTQVNEAHNLGILQQMLTHNIERVLHWEETLNDWYQAALERSKKKGIPEPVTVTLPFSQQFSFVHLDVHNYLSTAYTCDQYLDTIDREEVEWPEQVQEEFEQYSKDIRAIKGLRHYAQHESLLPYSVNQATDDDKVNILVNLADVQEMESQISQESPDGYSQGEEHHYGHIEGSRINISQQIREHYFTCSELIITIIETGVEQQGPAIDEYESIQLPTLADIDHPSPPPD